MSGVPRANVQVRDVLVSINYVPVPVSGCHPRIRGGRHVLVEVHYKYLVQYGHVTSLRPGTPDKTTDIKYSSPRGIPPLSVWSWELRVRCVV